MIYIKLLMLIPQLIELLKAIETGIKAAETDRKVKTDLTAIAAAVSAGDATKMNHIFAEKP